MENAGSHSKYCTTAEKGGGCATGSFGPSPGCTRLLVSMEAPDPTARVSLEFVGIRKMKCTKFRGKKDRKKEKEKEKRVVCVLLVMSSCCD